MSCTEESIIVVIDANDTYRIALYQFKSEPWPPAWWASITRVVATMGDATLDSSINSAAVDWSAQALDVQLGQATGLTEGWEQLRIRVYSPDAPNGRAVWDGLPNVEVMV